MSCAQQLVRCMLTITSLALFGIHSESVPDQYIRVHVAKRSARCSIDPFITTMYGSPRIGASKLSGSRHQGHEDLRQERKTYQGKDREASAASRPAVVVRSALTGLDSARQGIEVETGGGMTHKSKAHGSFNMKSSIYIYIYIYYKPVSSIVRQIQNPRIRVKLCSPQTPMGRSLKVGAQVCGSKPGARGARSTNPSLFYATALWPLL